MRINSIHLQNFRQHANTRVELDSGITGIIGPNGAGKTTLLEAIAWALYGQAAARGNRESIRFNRAAPRTGVRVELDFDLGHHRFRVVRGLTTAEVYLDGAQAPIATGINGVTELLQRRLGMTREEFFNTYFTGQKELNVMAAMKPTQRAQFLSRVLGYERLRTAQALARERRNLLMAEIAGLRGAMPDAEQLERMLADGRARLALAERRLADADRVRGANARALKEITPRWEAVRAERERIQRFENDIVVELHRIESMEREADRAARELAVLAESRARLEAVRAEVAPLASLSEELKKLDRLCREEGKRQTLMASVRALEEELAQLRERGTRLESAPVVEREAAAALAAKREELAQVEEQLEARRTDWVRDRQEAETKRDALRQQWLENKQQLDKLQTLGAQGICPTCSRPLGESYRPVVEELQAKVETLAVDGRWFSQRLQDLKDAPDDVRTLEERKRALVQESGPLERRIAKAQAAIQELEKLRADVAVKDRRLAETARDLAAIPAGFDAARHLAVQDQVERLRKREAEARGIEAALGREGTWTAERDRVAAAAGLAREKVERLNEERAALTFSEIDYATLESAFITADGAARAADIGFAEAQGDTKAARSTVAGAETQRQQLEQSREKLEALSRDRRLHEELDRAFTEIREDLNERMKPELAELASAFLEELTNGRYAQLELDDSYNIIVLEDGMQKPVISGGEEDLAHLVLRLAISQMIAERAGQTFSLLILDEVFGSLDESRRTSVVDLLRRLQDRFEQIILITHIESVREGVDRVISVRFDEETGASVIDRPAGEPLAESLETVEAELGLDDAAFAPESPTLRLVE